jgi:hypothetical protein
MMKKLVSIALICLVAISLLANSISSFTLCGGTLMQNLLNMSACTDTQEKFIGFRGTYFFYESESVGAALLFIGVLISVLFLFLRKRLSGK